MAARQRATRAALACAVAIGCGAVGTSMAAAPAPVLLAQIKMSDKLRLGGRALEEPSAVDSIVAVVNSDVVTRSELNTRIRNAERQISRQGSEPPPRSILERQVLERLIIEKAQMGLARDTGLAVEDAALDKAMERIAEQNKLSVADLRTRVESDGMSWDKFREDIRTEMLLSRVREREVDGKIQVSSNEIDAFLAEQNNLSNSQIELNIAQILLRLPENAGSDVIEATRKKAEALANDVRGGADFAKLAAANSNAPEALKGGELGIKAADRLPTLFVDAVATLKPGQITVVRSANGFHVLKLVERRDGAAATGPMVTQTRARHILIRPSESVTPAEAKRRLSVLKERLDNKAADFGELAKLNSQDTTAQRGGDLGWLYPGDTVPEFERAMNALAPGQISDVIESPFGFHLIQVLERKTEAVPLDRQKNMARQILRERKSDDAYQEWLRQLRDKTYVEIRLEDR